MERLMFTGLIETVGEIRSQILGGSSVRLGIAPRKTPFEAALGDSVSISGVCLTLEQVTDGQLYFRAVAETLRRTTLERARIGDTVNMERALRPTDRIGGHFVLGHVDGVGRIRSDRRTGDSVERTVEVPGELMPFMAEKGSVAIDGVSLTIAGSRAGKIAVSLIPYSLEHTTLSARKPGDQVNIECDVLARYIVHFSSVKDHTGDAVHNADDASLYDKLQRMGF
jgi:riboflavin synthase